MDDKKNNLISGLGLTTLEELDSSQQDYVSKLETAHDRASQIADAADEIAVDLGKALMDLTEITPLNEIDPQNPHAHYFVERKGVVYEACSEYFISLFNRGMPPEIIESFALRPLEGIKLEDLSAKEKAEYSQRQETTEDQAKLPTEDHLNLYAVTHPSEKLGAVELILKAIVNKLSK